MSVKVHIKIARIPSFRESAAEEAESLSTITDDILDAEVKKRPSGPGDDILDASPPLIEPPTATEVPPSAESIPAADITLPSDVATPTTGEAPPTTSEAPPTTESPPTTASPPTDDMKTSTETITAEDMHVVTESPGLIFKYR